MVRTNASWRSRRWRGETPTADLAAAASSGRGGARFAPTDAGQVGDRVMLASALAELPVRQRQAVVLRFFDDLSVEAVAQIMGCSAGTVKSQTAKGLTKLRTALGEDHPEVEEER